MANPPRGRPPTTAPPPPARGQRALTFLGGGVLVLAVAGGAWALFGRNSTKTDAAAIGPKVPVATAPPNPAGPIVPGTTPKATAPAATPKASAAAPTAQAPTSAPAAATTRATPAPTATRSTAPVATPAPSKAPVAPAPKPVAKPPVVAPQQGGTVAKAAYTFRVARGDTLWDLTRSTLAKTGRSTSNANVAAYVAKLYSANSSVIGSNPNLILVGSTITWPAGL